MGGSQGQVRSDDLFITLNIREQKLSEFGAVPHTAGEDRCSVKEFMAPWLGPLAGWCILWAPVVTEGQQRGRKRQSVRRKSSDGGIGTLGRSEKKGDTEKGGNGLGGYDFKNNLGLK